MQPKVLVLRHEPSMCSRSDQIDGFRSSGSTQPMPCFSAPHSGSLLDGVAFGEKNTSQQFYQAHEDNVSAPPLTAPIILEKSHNDGRFFESLKMSAKHFRSVRIKNVGDKIK